MLVDLPISGSISCTCLRAIGRASAIGIRPKTNLSLYSSGGETVLRAGDCAAFPKGSGNGHHMINKSGAMALYLEVGARSPTDVTICSDIDMMSSNADGRLLHKEGMPYPEPK